ncbi:helix-turn-helix domain-containing protein [Phascolarctobacterium succinatutens]|uniref:helix-turn-helix domain-containing protein n=1 Tax=Phascolarctobacterium succinatutens TaxID=626940 RepID=UPI00206DAB2E|nr:helix-turn-helix transcriptional regulator [Phascolarctobacterium succinatutens]DAL29523.1 MAG TPA_asm: Repressor protein CI [Caudoviricetes sp.]
MPIEDIKLKFAQNLKNIMQKRNKTQSDLVKDLSFRQATVSDWLNGKKYPRMDKVEKLANYLGVSINELLMQSVPESPVPALQLTDQEKSMIKKYRQLNADGKSRVDYVLNMEFDLVNNSAEKEEQNLG